LGKTQTRILESKTDFFIYLFIYLFVYLFIYFIFYANPNNPHSEWILQIKSKSGLLRFMILAVFLVGKGSENSTSVKQSSIQIYLSRHIFSRFCVAKHSIVEKRIQVIIPLRIFEKFSPKVQTEALKRQDNFICVPFL